MATVDWEEDEWELVNDDGFVYKRKKRPRVDPTATTTSSSAPPPSDPAAEENNRRERKKRALTKLRDKYQTEIDRWEHLSNVLKALQEKAQSSQQQQSHEQTATVSCSDSALGLPPPTGKSSENSNQRLLDDMLLRVEAEEAVIQDVSNLCDMAEAICNLQEETVKQTLVDLPVWASPAELMASLCDKQSEPGR